MSLRFWIFKDAEIAGPYSREDLAAQGLLPESLVCPEGAAGIRDEDWRSASEIAELSGLISSSVAVAPPEPSVPEFPSDAFAAPLPLPEGAPRPFEDPELRKQWRELLDSASRNQADLDVARERCERLEKELRSLQAAVEGYERRQNEMLEHLSKKDKQLEEALRLLEEARRNVAEPSLAGEARAPEPAVMEPAERENLAPPRLEDPAPVIEEEAPAVPRAPESAPEPPATEQGFELPPVIRLKPARREPTISDFTPPEPAPRVPIGSVETPPPQAVPEEPTPLPGVFPAQPEISVEPPAAPEPAEEPQIRVRLEEDVHDAPLPQGPVELAGPLTAVSSVAQAAVEPGEPTPPPAAPATAPTPAPKSPARFRSRSFVFTVSAAFIVLILAGALFFKDPKSSGVLFNMGKKYRPPEPDAMMGLDSPATAESAAPPPAPVSPPAPAPTPAPAPETAPAPAPSRDYIADSSLKAIEFVKKYELGGERRSVAEWLQYSFLTSENEEEWSAGALEADVYLVSYRVFKGGKSNGSAPISYIFEADLAKKTLRGHNQAARELLAGPAPKKKARKRRPDDGKVPLLPLPDLPPATPAENGEDSMRSAAEPSPAPEAPSEDEGTVGSVAP